MPKLFKIMFRSSTGNVRSDKFGSLYPVRVAMNICSKNPHLHFQKN